jgi:para-aminobenzoate synthetase component 1
LLSYDAGRAIEPRAQSTGGASDDRRWPAAVFLRFDAPAAFDHSRGVWTSPPPPHRDCPAAALPIADNASHSFPLLDQSIAYEADVARVIGYLRAGDAYQVNLAHRLTYSFRGCARSLFLRLAAAASPRYGAYMEFSTLDGLRRAVCCASPELFLSYTASTRRVETRPMKGTRPGCASAQSLLDAPKDSAELAMIVDLMRNDLGRVCTPGTMRVDHARTIERHGARPETALLQATATVRGTLSPGADLADLLAATFPPGSVTGAPKVRAMQIIDELEPFRRGPYCGAIGYISDTGDAAFNVAIRTALITGTAAGQYPGEFEQGVLDYSVGAGIVVESDPHAEWLETLDKARVLHAAHTQHSAPPSPEPCPRSEPKAIAHTPPAAAATTP